METTTISYNNCGYRYETTKEFNSLDDETFNDSIENITNSALYLSDTIEDFRNFFRTDKTEVIFSIKETLKKVFKLTGVQFKTMKLFLLKI